METTASPRRIEIASRPVALLLLAMLFPLLQGCSNAGEGAVSGAAVGALSGLAIGSLSGDAGKGAAIGAVVGGVGGAVIGDQNRRKEEAAKASAPQPAYATGAALGKFVGSWRIGGSVENNGQTLAVSGTGQGVVDKTYFVRLELKINDPRTGKTVEGTSILSQSGGRALEMTNSFSSSPQVLRFHGEMDPSGNVFTFTQYGNESSKIILRMGDNRTWTAERWDGNKRGETMTFSPA